MTDQELYELKQKIEDELQRRAEEARRKRRLELEAMRPAGVPKDWVAVCGTASGEGSVAGIPEAWVHPDSGILKDDR